MARVVVKNGDIDGALRNMKQKQAREGLLKKARERQDGYKKPGVRRRNNEKEMLKNFRKKNRKKRNA